MAILVFPALVGLAWPAKRWPYWKTIPQESLSGRETRIGLYSFPRWKYELKYNVLRSDKAPSGQAFNDWQTLAGFFNSVVADRDLWQFADNVDNAATAQSFGTGDGATKAFQLVRSFGGFIEPVYQPTGTPAIFDNGTPVAGGNYTIASGIITFTTAPASGHALTWTGSFNWLCRFDHGQAEFEQFLSNFWSLGKINFTTVKL